MKKKIILAIIIIVCSIPAMSQVQVGVKGGINIANVKYRDADPNTPSVSFNGGVLAKIGLSKDFFIRPEVQYSVKGYRFPAMGANGTGTLRLNYIAVPILAGFPIGDKFQGLIGPEFGFLTKATSVFSGNKVDMSDNYQHFDWGLDLGATYKITSTLGVELRYNYGFRGLVKGITTDQNGGQTGSTKDCANRVFEAGLYYLFVK
jgi:opacity protein-like surface antigen